MKWQIEFYADDRGHEPVVHFLETLSLEGKARVLRLFDLLCNIGVLLKEPYTKQIDGKLRELRTTDRQGEVRVLYFAFTGKTFVLLHGFIKKTEKTPKNEIEIA